MSELPNYTIEDFLENPYFQEWVLKPDRSHEDYWREWIANHPAHYPQLKMARKILLEFGKPTYLLEESEVQDLWKGIQKLSQPQPTKLSKLSNLPWLNGYRVAAALVPILLGIGWWMMADGDQVTYRTDFGETRELVLPDGSEVILNANSSLTVADWDSESVREVWISGEAFFKVQHLQNHQPFKVYSESGVEVEVLGTEFTIYQRNDKTKVFLSEGNVTLSFSESPQQSKILMSPGDLVEYESQKIYKKKVDPAAQLGWTTKVLQLESTTLRDMIRMAEENYGLQIVASDLVDLNQSASGSMPLEDGESFMKNLSIIFNLQISKEKEIYKID